MRLDVATEVVMDEAAVQSELGGIFATEQEQRRLSVE